MMVSTSQLTRRGVLAAGVALAACQGRTEPATRGPAPALKDAASFPVGAMAIAERLDDPRFVELLLRHYDQMTPGLELKMEALLTGEGGLNFGPADAMAAFAQRHGLRLFGHALVWHEQSHPSFERLKSQPRAFEAAYRAYIEAVAGRYRGRMAGWDVVNEPLNWNGSEWTGGLWGEALGQDYIPIAFEAAREADPQARLFLNDYNLETFPEKRRRFLALAESLLARGVPLGGLGTQMHMSVETDLTQIAACIRELGSLGLPVHISELDVALQRPRLDPRPLADALDIQAARVRAAADAFAALPAAQQFAFTTWGIKDDETYMRIEGYAKPDRQPERPLMFDDGGLPKPAFWAAVDAWR